MDYNKFNGKLIIQRLNRLQNTLQVFSLDSPLLSSANANANANGGGDDGVGDGYVTENTTLVTSADSSLVMTDIDEAWVDITHGVRFVNEGSHFLMLSERSGWRRLYMVAADERGGHALECECLVVE